MSNISTELPENVGSWNELFDQIAACIDKYRRMEDLHFLPEFVEWEVIGLSRNLAINGNKPVQVKSLKYELRYIELMALKEARANASNFTFYELIMLRDCMRAMGMPGSDELWDSTATKVNTLFDSKRKERRERARKNLPN